MASKTTSNDLHPVRPVYERLYTITKKLHDDFAGGQTTIERHVLEEMLAASQSMLLTLKDLLPAGPVKDETASAPPALKTAARKTPAKKTASVKEAAAPKSVAEVVPTKKSASAKSTAKKAASKIP